MSEVKYEVKGPGIMSVRNWLDARFEPGYFLRCARECDPEFPERILPGDWYSVYPLVHALERGVAALDEYETLEEFVELIAGDNARLDLTGIYRAFLWVASPRMFLRAATTIWANYANFGTLTEISNESGHYHAHIVGIPEDLLDWTAGAWKGFLPPAIELAGGRNSRATVLDRFARDDGWALVYELRYD